MRADRLTAGRAVVTLAVATGIAILLSSTVFDLGVFAVAVMVALLPLPLYLALVLWLDRYEPEPRALLATAFLWGASVSVLAAGLLNALADLALGPELGATVAGPIIEECAKGAILFVLFARRPDEFDGIIDGLIYAAMVSLGFAFVENISYYGRALAGDGAGGLAVTFTLRGVLSPFSHPLFTAMTGVGLGVARQSPRRWLRRTAPPAGLVAAIGLHGLWNSSTSMGCVFFAVYFLVMLPALAAVAIVAYVALKGEGRIVRKYLAGEVAIGLVPANEFEGLCCVRGRLDASLRAWMHGGRSAWRERRAFHHTASELAFLRHRVARGQQPPDPELEAAYLQALAGHARTGPDEPASA